MEGVDVPVVGGHSGSTIVPLFSKAVPKYDLPEERILRALDRAIAEIEEHHQPLRRSRWTAAAARTNARAIHPQLKPSNAACD